MKSDYIAATLDSKKGFYIGDICHVLGDDTYYGIWMMKEKFRDGVIEVGDHAFVVASTAYGDGSYYGSDGNEYGVDAGVIGCVPIEVIEMCPDSDIVDGNGDVLIAELNRNGRYLPGREARFAARYGKFDIVVDCTRVLIDTAADGDEEDAFDGWEEWTCS